MSEVKPEPKEEKKNEEGEPLILPPPLPPEEKNEPSTLEKVIENDVIIKPDEVGVEITITF
jgi:hypothetical protein